MKLINSLLAVLCLSGSAMAQDAVDTTTERINLHFQATYIYQYKPQFSAKYSGPHSLGNAEEKQNSLTATIYVGARLWKGAEVYIDPEVAGGNGLGAAFGMAGSTNGESFRVGDPEPSLYLARGYFKQTIALGDSGAMVEDGQNQLRERERSRFLRFSVGKFSLGDFFDNNNYSNSPRTQFLNWALMSNSAWDYAANVRGYTVGMVAAMQWDRWAYKLAIAALPETANGSKLNMKFGESRALNAEVTRATSVNKRDGHVRLLGYLNTANMGNYRLAIKNAGALPPDVVSTEKKGRTKAGFGINVDQQLSDNLSLFARIGWNDGNNETWAFTEADRTMSLGASLNGAMWHRKNDNGGVAVVVNGISADHSDYLAAGGLGFQLGDGRLKYGNEMITELYYSYKPMAHGIWLTGDYEFALNPGYNRDRGPLHVFSLRVHVEV